MNKKTVTLLILLAVMILAAVCFIKIDERNAVLTVESDGTPAILIRRDAYEVTARACRAEADDVWVFVLPAGMDDRVIYNDMLSSLVTVDGRELQRFASFEWEEGRTYSLSFETDGERRELRVRFETTSDIPSVFITTRNNDMEFVNNAKANIESGKILVIEPDGSASYSGRLTFHGRGNSSFFLFDKKPFNVKLEKAGSLLGMKKDKDWVFLANAWDYSYMNNKLAFDIAEKAGFRYVPQAEYADVWFNGEYWGLYLIAEKVEVDEERIDVTDLKLKNQRMNPGVDLTLAEPFDTGARRGVKLESIPENITGGYLIERDYRLQPDYPHRIMTPSYFETDAGTGFNIKSPEYADEREVEYIANLTNELEQAILSEDGTSPTGKSWLDYIDLTSWIRSYMVAEIAYDTDKDVTNAYYYKDTDAIDSKIYMGPVWDYDNRFGGHENDEDPEVLTKLAEEGWSQRLYDRKEFLEAVHAEWQRFFGNYLKNEALPMIDQWQKQIEKSVSLDLIRWPRGEGYPVQWPTDTQDQDIRFTQTYDFDAEVNHLKTWLKTRTTFLDRIWNE